MRFSDRASSGRQRKRSALEFLLWPSGVRTVDHRAAWRSRSARAYWRVRRWPCYGSSGSALPVPSGANHRRSCPRASPRGGAQHRARAVGEEHPQVAIPAFGDAPEMARTAGRIFLGSEAEPGGEVARITEVTHLAAGGCHHGGCGEQADAGNRQQRRARRRLAGKRVNSRSSWRSAPRAAGPPRPAASSFGG